MPAPIGVRGLVVPSDGEGADTANLATLTFLPGGERQPCLVGETVLDCATRAGAHIASVCGGRGICKSCVVRYTNTNVPPPSDQDRYFFSEAKLAKGWRRACQSVAQEHSQVQIPKRSSAEATRLFVAGDDIWVHPEPVVESLLVVLPAPTLQDNVSDADRLVHAVNQVQPGICESIDFQLIKTLSQFLRRQNWSVQAVIRDAEIIALLPVKSHMLGLAIDLGTTSIAILLVDMRTGSTVASAGIENPQGKYGADVIARISHAKGKPDVLLQLQVSTVDAINRAVAQMCAEHAVNAMYIVDIVVAGNTAMHHILLGLSVDHLGVAPYTPVASATPDVRARYLGLQAAPGTYLHAVHNIAGFVGGDHTAMLLGIRADLETRTVLALDVGTNTEMSLIHSGKIYSLSSPSGPALEGGNISCGMRAANGAIERIRITGEHIELTTIGDCAPVGLCGSGVLDAVAEFYRAGAVNFRGHIDQSSCFAGQDEDGAYLRLLNDGDDLMFTQQDIRNVQLSKGAIRAGIEILLEKAGLTAEQLDRVVVAGAFGVYIRLESAITIGMLPDLPLDRFEQVGNAAGIGAKLALLSAPLRQCGSSLATASSHIEQAGSKAFMDRFMRQLHLPQHSPD